MPPWSRRQAGSAAEHAAEMRLVVPADCAADNGDGVDGYGEQLLRQAYALGVDKFLQTDPAGLTHSMAGAQWH